MHTSYKKGEKEDNAVSRRMRIAQAQRELERMRLFQQRLEASRQTQAARAAASAQKAYEQALYADQKERARLYTESRIAQVSWQNELLERYVTRLGNLLSEALYIDSFIDLQSLISNLFQKMGLETRLTQASRDGGVDCVAYDPRPIFGGKVVIQAKRYKHTVGVSAVRDLFGTMQNEGASKGILVTTSGYGKASFEFADGKPIELLSGSHLLYLLAQHAGIEAKIEIPDDWKDPQLDSQA